MRRLGHHNAAIHDLAASTGERLLANGGLRILPKELPS
jgi:hypothetical protein